MNDIATREDLGQLVRTFYTKVRADATLGPVFNAIITNDEAWEEHYETLTEFWQANVFFTSNYRGNPIRAHQQVDRNQSQSVERKHFDRWLELWHATVDELFAGEKAHLAKTRAINMAELMLLKIQMGRSATNR